MNIIILAAGKGTRMKSDIPKVLHEIAGKPMLQHVIDTSLSFVDSNIFVVIGHESDKVKSYFNKKEKYQSLSWVQQDSQLGTGHAVQQAMQHISNTKACVILYGDVPLISKQKIAEVYAKTNSNDAVVITAHLPEPGSLGRILRNDQDEVIAIREFKDASESEKQIQEINSGIMAIAGDKIGYYLSNIKNNNAQKEYYLTDIIELAVKENDKIASIVVTNLNEISGVNSPHDLQLLERAFQTQRANELLDNGCYLVDSHRFDIRGSLIHGKDCHIDVNCIIEGDCRLGDRVKIAANVIIKNSTIASDVIIEANSIIDGANIASGSQVGPFARIRPETVLLENSKIGNFVEVKKSSIGMNSKVNHLSYIGDSELGRDVNIGAGVITCNYDGAHKHKTSIGDNVFVGSDSQLIAPVNIGNNATIAAGTTLYKDAHADKLTLNQRNIKQIDGWKRPQKK